jgi:hypothetical protein
LTATVHARSTRFLASLAALQRHYALKFLVQLVVPSARLHLHRPTDKRRHLAFSLSFFGSPTREKPGISGNWPCRSRDGTPATPSHAHLGSGDGGNRPGADTGETGHIDRIA